MSMTELSGKIQTVLGLIDPSDLGITLTHEHIHMEYTRFRSPAPEWVQNKWNEPLNLENLWWIRRWPFSNKNNLQLQHEFDAWEEELKFYHQNGGRSIVDVSNHGLGRDIKVLVELSKANGVHIISGTGWYVGASHPENMTSMTQEMLTQIMVDEITRGADGSDAKCGVIGEIGCSNPLKANEKKVLQASAIAQSQLGCPVIIHPGLEGGPVEDLRVLQEAGGDVNKTVMSHMDTGRATTKEELLEFAKLGCYIEYDFFGTEVSYYQVDPRFDVLSDAQRINFFKDLIDEGYEDQIVMSHDIHTKCQLMKYGGHGYSHILLNVIPKMLLKDITQAQIDKITIHNPKRWLTFK